MKAFIIVFYFIFIVFICLITMLIYFSCLNKEGKRKFLSFWLYVLIVVFIFFLSFKVIKDFFPIPLKVRQIYYTVFTPIKLSKSPCVLYDDFSFHEKGYSKTYILPPIKYLGFYVVAIKFKDRLNIINPFTVEGALELEFFRKGKLIFRQYIDEVGHAGDTTGRGDRVYKLMPTFKIPMLGKYLNDIEVKITVIKPYKVLNKKEIKAKVCLTYYFMHD